MKKLFLCLTAVVLVILYPAVFNAAEKDASIVIKKSQEEMGELKSYSATIELKQLVTDPATEEVLLSKFTEINQQVIKNPFILHQIVSISNTKEKQDVQETYWTKEGLFELDIEGNWRKTSPEKFSSIEKAMQIVQNLPAQLIVGATIANYMSLEEKGGSYLLRYEGKPENLLTFMRDTVENPANDLEVKALLGDGFEQLNVRKLSYELTIDKQTSFFEALHITADFNLMANKEKLNMKSEIDLSFSDYNEIEGIALPEHILSKADETSESKLGGSLPATGSSNPVMMVLGLCLSFAAGTLLLIRRRLQ